MWRAWVGFNFSHSLGLVLLGGCTIWLGFTLRSNSVSRMILLVPVAVGGIYVWLAVRYWFWMPAVGTAIATAGFIVAWVLY